MNEQTIDDRVRDLERRLRRFRRAAGGLLALAVVVLVSGQMTKPKEVPKIVEAQAFRIVDENGRVRGAWGVAGDSSTIGLMDKNQQFRIGLSVDTNNESALTLFDGHGKPRGMWVVGADGVTMLRLIDKNGQNRGVWWSDADGFTTLGIVDKAGTYRTVLGKFITLDTNTGSKRNHQESSLLLFDKDDKLLFTAP